MREAASYESFRAALSEFVREACAQMKRRRVPKRRWTSIDRKPDGSISLRPEQRPDYMQSFLEVVTAAHNNPSKSLREAIDVVRRDPVLSAVLLVDAAGNPVTHEAGQVWWITTQLTGVVQSYLARVGEPVFEDSAFDALFAELWSEVTRNTVTVTELSPLAYTYLDCEGIEIAPQLRMRKLYLEEIEQWVNEPGVLPSPLSDMSAHELARLDCGIEVAYEATRAEVRQGRELTGQQMTDLVTAITLLTDSAVFPAFTVKKCSSMLWPVEHRTWGHKPVFGQRTVKLSSSLIQDLKGTWQHMDALPADDRIRLPLRRWDMVQGRATADDALVDSWIALEPLFAPESSHEIRYRASLRIAAFLAENGDEGAEIYRTLKKSYDLRSDIVHGHTEQSRQKASLVAKTRSYLRRSLLKILASSKQFSPEQVEIDLLSRRTA